MPPQKKNRVITEAGDPVGETTSKRQMREVDGAEDRPESSPLEKPQGSPDVVPWRHATRRQKAAWGPILDYLQAKKPTSAMALAFQADIEDAILAVALLPAAAEAWAAKVADDDLMTFAGWYLQGMGDEPGEA